MRLAGGVAQHRRALGGDGGREGVLGAGDARLVEEDVGAAELLRAEDERVVEREARAELLQREEVRVDAAPADDVAARRRQLDRAAAGEQRAGEQDGARGSSGRAPGSSSVGPQLLRVDRERVAAVHSALRADGLESSTSVSTSRMRGTFSRWTGSSVRSDGGDDGQGGVLVARRADAAGRACDRLGRRTALRSWEWCDGRARDGRRPEYGEPGNIPGARGASSGASRRWRRARAGRTAPFAPHRTRHRRGCVPLRNVIFDA